MRKKTLGSVRAGIEYQDLIAAESLLKMIQPGQSPNSAMPPISVTLEDRRGGRFDDVAEWYPKQIIWQQVKWAEHPATDPFSLDSMARPAPGRQTSLVAGFAASFRMAKSMGLGFQLHLISNRTGDTELRSFLEGEPPRFKPKLGKKRLARLEGAWLRESGLAANEFRELIAALRFRIGSIDLHEREQLVQATLRGIGVGVTGAFDQLMSSIADWSSRAGVGHLSADDVRAALGPLADYPDNRFKVPRETLVARTAAHRRLAKLIGAVTEGYLAVLAPPGAGKSTMLNTFEESPLARGYKVIVYNCFTGVGDTFLMKRASAENFAVFLAKQLYQRLGSRSGSRSTAGPEDIEALLTDAGNHLEPGERLIIIIDGVDYARRNKTQHTAALIDTLPPSLPANVVIVLSAQAAEQLPDHLRGMVKGRALTLPPLTTAETERLLEQHGVFDAVNRLSAYDRRSVRTTVHEISKGHPLHSTYVARAAGSFSDRGNATSLIAFVRGLEPYDNDIRIYYDRIFAPPAPLARRLIGVLAACPFPLSPTEASSLLPGPKADSDACELAISQFAMLFDRRGDRFAFAHDSLRAYVRDNAWNPLGETSPFVDFLEAHPDDRRHGEYLASLLAHCGDHAHARSWIDCDWLARQLARGCRPTLVQEGLEELATDAARHRDWANLARWSLLRERFSEAASVELDSSELFTAWVAAGDTDRVEHRAFDGQVLDLHWSTALTLAHTLDRYKRHEFADRLRAAAADEPFRDFDDSGPMPLDEASRYFRNLASHRTAGETLGAITEFAREQSRSWPHGETATCRRLAADAAFACLRDSDGERVRQWLAIRPVPLGARDLTVFRAYRAVLEGTTSKNLTAVNRVLREALSWDFLAALLSDHKALVQTSVTARALPGALTVSRYAWFETENRTADLRDLYHDVRMSIKLGLDGRLTAVRQAIDALPATSHRPVCRLVFGLAYSSATARPWGQGADVVLAEIRKLDHHAAGMSGSGPIEHFMKRAGDVMKPLRELAVAAGEAPAFAAWVERELLPALKTVGLHYSLAHESVLTQLLRPDDDDAVYERVLSGLEGIWQQSDEQKSGGYMRAATAAAPLDRHRASSLVGLGARAAFTYGYHKDMTVNAAIAALRAIGGVLSGDELAAAAVRICVTLDVVGRVTDYDHVNDNAGEFVAVVASFDVPLAARAASALQSRLNRHMWRTTIADAAAVIGMDLRALRSEFRSVAPDVLFGDASANNSRRNSTRAASGSARTFSQLLELVIADGSGETGATGERNALEKELLAAAAEKAQLVEAERVLLLSSDQNSTILARFARRAYDLGERQLAFEYARRSVAAGDPLIYGYWYEAQTNALVDLCRADATRARPIFERAVLNAVEGEFGIGFGVIPVLCRCLLAFDDHNSAKAVFAELLTHLREITSMYPCDEQVWRGLLGIGLGRQIRVAFAAP